VSHRAYESFAYIFRDARRTICRTGRAITAVYEESYRTKNTLPWVRRIAA
jgi:hypothetical protein